MQLVTFLMAFTLAFLRTKAFASIKNAASCTGTITRLLSLKGGAGFLPEADESKAFYALGINIALQVGGELKNILSKEELSHVVSGFSDSIQQKITDDKAILSEYGPILNIILQKRAESAVESEKEKGKDFIAKYLAENPTAVESSSGLVYKEVLAGSGPQPSVDSTVVVHYHGTLIDGTVFDSSTLRGDPLTFPLKNVIRGWIEGVTMMKLGGKATLVVPSSLAYGDSGSPPVIPPGATLIFDVELLEIK
eukprot:gene4124-5878_t